MRQVALACTLFLIGCGAIGTQNTLAKDEPDASRLPIGDEAASDCDHIVDHVTLRRCTELERDRADHALNMQFQTTLRRLRQVNTEDFAIAKSQGFATDQYRQEQENYVTSLLRSQQAWLTYRKEYCNVARFPGRGGNSNLENLIVCELPLIKARTEQLQILTKELKSGG